MYPWSPAGSSLAATLLSFLLDKTGTGGLGGGDEILGLG